MSVVGTPHVTTRIDSERALPFIFGTALLFSAMLMFFMEPMVAKAMLPLLGGSPTVWNTCVVFFQAMLLAGYLYAHAGSKWLGESGHALLHTVLLVASLLTLHTVLQVDPTPNSSDPVTWLLIALVKSIGLPFFLLATSAPLLQKWFSRSGHQAATDPYFLYAASNFGSLVGLLSYPTVVEPLLPLHQQATLWRFGYIGFVVTVIICSLLLRRTSTQAAGSASTRIDNHTQTPGLHRRLRWIALSFVPSSLMLAVTTFISTDVAAVPLLWILPLLLYLLTFVLVFSSPPRYPRDIVERGLPVLILPLVLLMILQIGGPIALLIPLHVSVFFLAALGCHRLLADDRPSASNLTAFYVLVAFGGVLGSLFNTLVAPLIFTGVIEYPIVLVMVCLVRPLSQGAVDRRWSLAGPIAVALSAGAIMVLTANIDSLTLRFAVLGIPAFLCLSLSRTRVPFAVSIAALLLATGLQRDQFGTVLHAERTFFGAYRVWVDPTGRYRMLTHGTTLHGMQSVLTERRAEPLSYYHRTGPLGEVLESVPAASYPRFAAVGLGVGSVAAYRKPAQTVTFFEIDPAVERLARRQQYFSYLADCGSSCHVVIGDARRSLAANGEDYGIIILDAFSSDAIPIHLLTREAVAIYLHRLAAGGVLAFHISNRHLNLEPVLARVAKDAGLESIVRRDRLVPNAESGKTISDWVVMGRAREDLGFLYSTGNWRETQTRESVKLWTDDFSNILTLLLHR